MAYTFSNCKGLQSLQGISNWNTINVTTMTHLFEKCEIISKFLLEIKHWNLSNTTDISYMFAFVHSLPSIHQDKL